MSAAQNHNIVATFLKAASDDPQGVALVQDDATISYAQLRDNVTATAAYYQSRGIGKGDMVLVFVPMSLPLYRVVLALFYIGACPVFLDEWVSIGRLKECLKVVDCKALIAKPAYLFLSLFIGPMRRIPVKIAAGRDVPMPAAPPSVSDVSGEDTALVTFTTGSTGIPKAANRTHDYLYAQLHALSPLLSGVASPCVTLLPIVVLLHLAAGKTAILPPKRFKALKPRSIAHLANAIASSSARGLIASPAIVSMLVNHAHSSADRRLHAALGSIKSVITGGGPVYPSLAGQLTDCFPAATITAVYGSTEAEPISHIDAAELGEVSLETLLAKGLPVGLPDRAAEVAILALDAEPPHISTEKTLGQYLVPIGTPGEVIVAGNHVLKHYINNPAAEAQTKLLADGKVWHRTGDVGMLDAEGSLYLLGRCNQLFTWRRQSYHPAIITYALQALAGVGSAALLLQGSTPVLILEEQDRKHLPQVTSALPRVGLAGATVRFIRKIPKDPRHQTKVDYAKLKASLRM
jgi:acyl-CoA synthetase (AMP-forming)/AMP-acid ligase II